MNNSKFNRNHYYTLLAVGKQQLGWDDEFYYGIWLPMQGATKKDERYSATTLTNSQLFSAVEAMKAKGFKVKSARSGNRKLAADPQSKKIRSLWLELHAAGKVRDPSEPSLLAYVKRQTGRDGIDWLSNAQASNVIESLKRWLAR